jgi:4-hydroxy-3-polyprenylbenzoate decarboxylase
MFLSHLKKTLGIRGVKRVKLHERLTALRRIIIVVVEKNTPQSEIWRALQGAAAFRADCGKICIAVDEDIDPENADAVFWALAFRMNPSSDLQVINYRSPGHGPEREHEAERVDATLLMDATRKEELPPLALPKREFMERAGQIWDELGLPKRRPQSPWCSPGDGDWLPQWDAAALRAVQGRYAENGEISKQQKRSGMKPETRYRPDLKS